MLAPAPTSPPTCSTTHLLYSAACESPAPHPLSHSAVTGNVVTQQIIDSQDAFSAQRQKPEPQEGNAQGHSARKQQSQDEQPGPLAAQAAPSLWGGGHVRSHALL